MYLKEYENNGDTGTTNYKEFELEITKQEGKEFIIQEFINSNYDMFLLGDSVEVECEDKYFTIYINEYFDNKDIKKLSQIGEDYLDLDLDAQDIIDILTSK